MVLFAEEPLLSEKRETFVSEKKRNGAVLLFCCSKKRKEMVFFCSAEEFKEKKWCCSAEEFKEKKKHRLFLTTDN